jgi:hypothetical protein
MGLQFVGLQKNLRYSMSRKISQAAVANLLSLAISVRFITSKTKGLSSGNVLAD